MGFGAILAWFSILTSGRSGTLILETLCIKGLRWSVASVTVCVCARRFAWVSVL